MVKIEGEEDVVWLSDSETPAMICSVAGDVEVLNISFPSPDVRPRAAVHTLYVYFSRFTLRFFFG